jgi:hypothetical protein
MKLLDIRSRLEQARGKPGNFERLVGENPMQAAMHDASHRLLLERAAERAVPVAAVEQTVGTGVDGPGL